MEVRFAVLILTLLVPLSMGTGALPISDEAQDAAERALQTAVHADRSPAIIAPAIVDPYTFAE